MLRHAHIQIFQALVTLKKTLIGLELQTQQIQRLGHIHLHACMSLMYRKLAFSLRDTGWGVKESRKYQYIQVLSLQVQLINPPTPGHRFVPLLQRGEGGKKLFSLRLCQPRFNIISHLKAIFFFLIRTLCAIGLLAPFLLQLLIYPL